MSRTEHAPENGGIRNRFDPSASVSSSSPLHGSVRIVGGVERHAAKKDAIAIRAPNNAIVHTGRAVGLAVKFVGKGWKPFSGTGLGFQKENPKRTWIPPGLMRSAAAAS